MRRLSINEGPFPDDYGTSEEEDEDEKLEDKLEPAPQQQQPPPQGIDTSGNNMEEVTSTKDLHAPTLGNNGRTGVILSENQLNVTTEGDDLDISDELRQRFWIKDKKIREEFSSKSHEQATSPATTPATKGEATKGSGHFSSSQVDTPTPLEEIVSILSPADISPFCATTTPI
jgi:hypothetical protein